MYHEVFNCQHSLESLQCIVQYKLNDVMFNKLYHSSLNSWYNVNLAIKYYAHGCVCVLQRAVQRFDWSCWYHNRYEEKCRQCKHYLSLIFIFLLCNAMYLNKIFISIFTVFEKGNNMQCSNYYGLLSTPDNYNNNYNTTMSLLLLT